MISALERFDRVTAAGILARAALSLEGNPEASFRVPGEEQLRAEVIEEAIKRHNLPDDRSAATLERLGDALDLELDSLTQPGDEGEALQRLSVRGSLPSDLFQIEIVKEISDFHGYRFAREQQLIEQTVRSPDREQHYGPPNEPGQPFLISLFAKFYPGEFPARSFTLLVAGQRNGLELSVHQAWRIYADLGIEATTLVDVLRKFSDVMGFEITIGNQTGKFILAEALPEDPTSASYDVFKADWRWKNKYEKFTYVTVSYFLQWNPQTGKSQAALGVGVDLNRYRAYLKARGY